MEVVKVAKPVVDRLAAPSEYPLSTNATVPVGVPLLLVTFVMKVTDSPTLEGLKEELTTVVVAATKLAVTFLGALITTDCGFVVPVRSPLQLLNTYPGVAAS